MNAIQITETCRSNASRAGAKTNRLAARRPGFLIARPATTVAALLLLISGASPAHAQSMRFRSSPVRVTVPLNSTNSTLITNSVNLSAEMANATFSVSGLPAGAGAILTDTNLTPVSFTTQDTNLWLTVNTTNIAEGLYPFTLNASGSDTNGTPVTNHIRFILQAAHIWNGSVGVSNAWNDPASWLAGIPVAGSDVVFGDQGAQTNTFTNSFVTANTTIGSLRFSQTGLTNAQFHSIRINPGVTLSVTGTNGLSLLRDHVDEFYGLGTMTVNFGGGAGSRLVVSNDLADIGVLLGNQAQPTLSLSNLETFVAQVSRLGFSEYQLYPNYRNYNDQNDFGDNPRRFISHIFLARTNFVRALWADPQNYTNELTRTYSLSYENSETSGVGSTVNSFFYLGQSNAFFLDSVCFIRANHATGNGGFVRFNPSFPNSTAIFRNTNGGRMSVFTISDDGGTNRASSNVKANIDFAAGNGLVDILADRFYISRDRTLINSNQTPNVQGDLWLGRGIIDVNTAILGFQEQTNKTDWTTIGGAQPYLNYCQGRLVVTNTGTFKVNGTLTLGYTADTNPSGSAQQFNTFGQITVHSNSTVMASNIVVDGGLNLSTQDRISLPGGTLIVTNTVGGAPGIRLETLTMTAGRLVLHVSPSKTNVLVKNLLTPGSSPSVIKIASLTGIASFPAQVPVISYETAAPFLVADVTSLGAGFSAYVLDNGDAKTVDIYITTNAPNNLRWTGSANGDWDTTSLNWVTAVGGVPTNFTIGDIVTFDDSSPRTNVNVVGSVVPGQAGTGVTITNTARSYTFTGGTIAGTALMAKQGTGSLAIDSTKQGPLNITSGTVTGSGAVGLATVAAGATLRYAGAVNGGLNSVGTVWNAGTITGPVSITGGSFVNSNIVDTVPGVMNVNSNAVVTNYGTISINGNAQWEVFAGCTLANFGTINNNFQRVNIGGLLLGTGDIYDIDGGLAGADARVQIRTNPNALVSPGSSIGTLNLAARVDLTEGNPNFNAGRLLIEVDFTHQQTNDIVRADRWNNIGCVLVMTNINPGAGSFGAGQVFQILQNNNGIGFSNFVDTPGIFPLIQPTMPGPGLQWDLSGIRVWGTLGVTNSGMVWNGGTGIWSTNVADTNWKGPIPYADGLGAILDDSASGTTTITLNGDVFPAGTTNAVNAPSFSPGVIVSNATKDYTITGTGRISGLASLYKTGPGLLTILTTNNFTGGVTVDGGTVAVTNVAGLGVAGYQGAYNRLTLDGATLKYIGTINGTLPRATGINANNATIEVTSGTNQLQAGAIIGPGRLTKTGPGMLFLAAASSHSGGTVVSNGTLQVNGNDRVGTNTLTLAGGSLLFSGNAFTFTNAISIVAGSTIINTNPYVTGGPWSGTGSVAISNTSVLTLNASIASYAGALSLGATSGNLRFNNATNANNCRGSTLATFDLGTGSGSLSNLNGGGLTYDLGALLGGANTILGGRTTNVGVAGTTYSIGANGSNSVFSGKIVNGNDTVSINKVGSGTLTLNGNNTHTGLTTVSAGTLAGTAAFAGPVSVSSGGALSPGTSIGTMTINNALTLAGTMSVEVSRNGFSLNSDRVVGLTSVSFGGGLVVTNIGPDAVVQGNNFQLFNTGGSGNFTSITPALAPPLSWVFNPTTGVLSVDGPLPTLGFTNTGSGLTFSWINTGGKTYKLQAQTNSISVGISTNWADYPGGGNSPVPVPFDLGQGTVFFRLISLP